MLAGISVILNVIWGIEFRVNFSRSRQVLNQLNFCSFALHRNVLTFRLYSSNLCSSKIPCLYVQCSSRKTQICISVPLFCILIYTCQYMEYMIILYEYVIWDLTLLAPIPQNGQKHSINGIRKYTLGSAL